MLYIREYTFNNTHIYLILKRHPVTNLLSNGSGKKKVCVFVYSYIYREKDSEKMWEIANILGMWEQEILNCTFKNFSINLKLFQNNSLKNDIS